MTKIPLNLVKTASQRVSLTYLNKAYDGNPKNLIVHVYKCYVFSPGWANNQSSVLRGRLECSQCFLLIVNMNSGVVQAALCYIILFVVPVF